MPRRIVSLLPSATEIVCLLGAREELVGVSHECDEPPDVRDLPSLTSSRLPALGDSAAIDATVRDALDQALSIYAIDRQRLQELAPDVIVTQDLCEVCAVSYQDVCRAVDDLLGPDVTVVNLHPLTLTDVFDDIERTARALGREAAGQTAVAGLRSRLEDLRSRTAAVAVRPSVLTIEWTEPVMLGATWMPELIEIAGGISLGAAAGEKAVVADREQLAALDPDVVLLKPCGFSVSRTLAEKDRLVEILPWGQWRACRDGRVYVADGSAYFNRPGPRLVDSAELLAACLHPGTVPELVTRHHGSLVRLGFDLSVHD